MAVGEDEVKEKSCPFPVSATVKGAVALSVTVNTPVRVPPCVGSKKTPIEQLDPAATVFPQALREPKSPVFVVTPDIVMLEDSLLVSVTVCGSPNFQHIDRGT